MTKVLDLELDAKTKGVPLARGSVRLGDVGKRGWNVVRGNMMLPLLTVRDARMKNNMRLMRGFAAHHGVALAPHGKTTMCPQLYREMIEDGGAWGITVATVQQAAVAAATGVERILLANEVVGQANVEQLAELKAAHPETRIYSLVDSPETVEQLVRYGKPRLPHGERFQVLAEVGHRGGRTGARTMDRVIGLFEVVRRNADALVLSGIEGFEGTIKGEDVGGAVPAIDAFLDFALDALGHARSSGAFDGQEQVLLSAGGSAYFDRVVAKFGGGRAGPGTLCVLRGGCYLTYDHGVYLEKLREMDRRGGLEGAGGRFAAASGFQPALELWAMVESLEDPGVAIMTMGIRDLPHDAGWPVPLRQYRDQRLLRDLAGAEPPFKITHSNDQHCYLSYPDGTDIRVGDLLAFGISHPCTAFDKWDVLYRVDEDFTVIGALKTFF